MCAKSCAYCGGGFTWGHGGDTSRAALSAQSNESVILLACSGKPFGAAPRVCPYCFTFEFMAAYFNKLTNALRVRDGGVEGLASADENVTKLQSLANKAYLRDNTK